MKKGGTVGFLVLLLLFLGTASSFMYLLCSRKGSTVSVIPAVMGSIRSRSGMSLIVKSRKLKDNFDPPSPEQDGEGLVSLEDYRPIDPVPSSKTSIRHGPIQHEAPSLPYIPQPAPPPIEQSYSSYP